MKLNFREKRFILMGILSAAAVAIFYAGTLLLPDSENLSRSVELKQRMLRSQRETVAREDYYRTRLEQYRKQLDLDLKRFLPGDNPNMAGAELQRVVKDFADRSGVEIITRTLLPDKKVQDTVAKVSIRIDTNCAPEQLVQFMAAIESYEKLLKIDEIQIVAFKLGKKSEMRPSMVISGFISVPEDKPKSEISQNRFPLNPNVGGRSCAPIWTEHVCESRVELSGSVLPAFALKRKTGCLLFNGKRGTENGERA